MYSLLYLDFCKPINYATYLWPIFSGHLKHVCSILVLYKLEVIVIILAWLSVVFPQGWVPAAGSVPVQSPGSGLESGDGGAGVQLVRQPPQRRGFPPQTGTRHALQWPVSTRQCSHTAYQPCARYCTWKANEPSHSCFCHKRCDQMKKTKLLKNTHFQHLMVLLVIPHMLLLSAANSVNLKHQQSRAGLSNSFLSI